MGSPSGPRARSSSISPTHDDSSSHLSSHQFSSRSLLKPTHPAAGPHGEEKDASGREAAAGTGYQPSESSSQSMEMGDLSDAGYTDDEETGLTEDARKQRRRRRQQQQQQNVHRLDGRLLPHEESEGQVAVPLSRGEEKRLADRAVLRSSAVNVVLIGLWYFFSLTISIYNEWMFNKKHLDFHFPLFTTCAHMIVQFSLSSLVLYFLPRFRPKAGGEVDGMGNRKPIMSTFFYLTRIAPCGAATGLDIGLGNTSMQFITLTFFTMCKSSSLGFVLLFAFLFRLEAPSWKLVAIIAVMTGGVVLMVFGETAFKLTGFVLVIMSSFFSGFRWALTQILLIRNPATSNPFASIFFLAPVMFVTLFIIAVPVEGFPALGHGLSELFAAKGPLMGVLLLLFPGVIAFCMTSAEFALLQRTSVVTLSICGIFKEVVTISAAEITYHDPLTPINLSGLLITIVAIAAYNYLKIKKMRESAREKVKERTEAEASEEREGMLAGGRVRDER